ncbi:helix-turn-helix domain-containing protein [Sulfitobacter sp.]|uniref:helix-turn-helix domain-containing protein n=1 Tax=Sulfitobacter sp. TaxID=1903071 RepID=UPI0025CE74CC|nr:helix-turn-helix domain-containing protein [Sulfitobacter sp.]
MSHVATNWAFAQRGLKPATKLILLCLADRHNPDMGCFPSQDTLAQDACISRSALNEHLKSLESAGLIRRETRFNPTTHRQKSTRYILGFEDGFIPDDVDPCPKSGHGTEKERNGEPCPETGHGAVSGKQAKPCPDLGQSRVRKPDTNPVREPIRGTSKARARKSAPAVGVSDLFDRFCSAHPKAAERDAVYRAWCGAVEDGANPARLVVLAQRYGATPEAQRGYAKKAQNWLRDGAWREEAAYPARSAPASIEDRARFWADRINDGKFVAASSFGADVATRMMELALVTGDQLRAIGIKP